MKALIRIFISWLPLGIAITGLCLIVYISAQQGYRQSFNDPQVQLAEDAVAFLKQGVQVGSLVGDRTVDIRNSESPFIIVYDKNGTVLGGNGMLDGAAPTPPHGVFENVAFWRWGHTWQPDRDVRIDAVVIPFTSPSGTGYVLAGRSMRVMEMHVENTGSKVFLAWFLLLVATFLAKGVARFFS